MRAILAALAVSVTVGQALAIDRYQTMRMSCDEVQALLNDSGAAILGWQSTISGLPLYNRYVRDSRACKSNEVSVFANVPTKDERACTVRKCEIKEPFDRGGRIFIPR
ncbi:MAG TPA: hypothetical protein VIU14_10865 [Mesorhizobium sp.]|jgi:hypothetical protein